MIGGGTKFRPGEISLAHLGILFLDEFPEFNRSVIESLRQPLETGQITIGRAGGNLFLLARFILIAAMNLCPCGFKGIKGKNCFCTPEKINKYRQKISGPILDRIDLQVEVSNLSPEELNNRSLNNLEINDVDNVDNIEKTKETIKRAREIQTKRLSEFPYPLNAYIPTNKINLFCRVNHDGLELISAAAKIKFIKSFLF